MEILTLLCKFCLIGLITCLSPLSLRTFFLHRLLTYCRVISSFEFDSLVTAPLSKFPTAIAYYRWASASNTIRDIRVPFLGISALDDPIVDSSGIPFEAVEDNEWLTFAVTKHGGHVSLNCNFSTSTQQH